jgi:hypothetical protein
MNATQRWALCALLVGAALSARAQDEMILGAPLHAARGEFVRVSVFFRDNAGTRLGAGGVPIQWIDFSITHSRPDLVVGCLGTTYPNCDLRFEAAGQLAASTPEISGTLINIASLYVRRIFGAALSFTPGELTLIGVITFRLDPNAPIGTMIRLQFDPAKTFIANHDGTVIDSALTLGGTSVDIEVCPTDPPATPSFDFSGPVSGCFAASSASPALPVVACRAGEDVQFSTFIPIDACDTVSWSFGDGTGAFTNGATVRHRFTLPPGFPVGATYTVNAMVKRASGSASFSREVSIEAGCTATVPETAVAGAPVTFIADSVPPGFALFTSWKFGDGTAGVGNPLQHTYQFGATYLWEATIAISGQDIPCIVRRPIAVSGPPLPRRRATS